MRKLLRHVMAGVGLLVLSVTSGAGDAKADPIYRITLAITDDTTQVTTVFTIGNGSTNDTNSSPDGITVSSALNTSATGVSLTSVAATTTSSSAGISESIQGTATLVSGSTDTYSIAVTTTHDSYLLPTGITTATLTQSESGTFTNSLAGGTQAFQVWYNPGSAPDVTAGITPGQMSIAIPETGTTPQKVSATSPGSTTFPGYIVPYTLTDQVTMTVTGNGSATNTSIQFMANDALTAPGAIVPEPSSLVMYVTGMPASLAILGLLRRRKARRRRAEHIPG